MDAAAGRTPIRRRWVGQLPAGRPAEMSELEWLVLRRHVAEGVSYAALAQELGVSRSRIREVTMAASARLRGAADVAGTELDGLSLTPQLKGALLRAGYRGRAQLAAATDEDLLGIRGFGARRLARLRAALRAEARHLGS